MRDIDQIIDLLLGKYPDLLVEQLRVLHPGADDDGLWFFRHASSPHEVQLESSSGKCPFLFETDASAQCATVNSVAEAVDIVAVGLGLAAAA
jgi:hypothetical protein